jgi:hypothetical protein
VLLASQFLPHSSAGSTLEDGLLKAWIDQGVSIFRVHRVEQQRRVSVCFQV